MLSKASTFLITSYFFLLVILCYIQSLQAARQLEDISPSGFTFETPVPVTVQIPPPPTPAIDVNNTGETRKVGGGGSAHVQTISVNNKTTSQGDQTVTGQDGKPIVMANNNNASATETVYGPSGKPQVNAKTTVSSETSTVNGSDGKPQYEVETFDNGTLVITFYVSDGKPSFHMTYQAPPGNQNSNKIWSAPPGFSFPPHN